jgi:hypothetical protein
MLNGQAAFMLSGVFGDQGGAFLDLGRRLG